MLLALVACACASEEVEIPDELRGEPACMWIIDTHLHLADGSTRLIHDETLGYTGTACACLTKAEFELELRHAELNDDALRACEGLAARREHEWNECLLNHGAGRWLGSVFWAKTNFDTPAADSLGCVGE